MANSDCFWDVLTPDREVDRLASYTLEMWGMITEIIAEWYRISVPRHSKSAWGPAIIAPPGARVELCKDRHEARVLHSDVRDRYFQSDLKRDRMSVFAGYGLRVENEFERERDGVSFLERQVAHITTPNQRVFVVSTGLRSTCSRE